MANFEMPKLHSIMKEKLVGWEYDVDVFKIRYFLFLYFWMFPNLKLCIKLSKGTQTKYTYFDRAHLVLVNSQGMRKGGVFYFFWVSTSQFSHSLLLVNLHIFFFRKLERTFAAQRPNSLPNNKRSFEKAQRLLATTMRSYSRWRRKTMKKVLFFFAIELATRSDGFLNQTIYQTMLYLLILS